MKENFISSYFSKYDKKGYVEGRVAFLAMNDNQQKQIEQYLFSNFWWNFVTAGSLLIGGILLVEWIFF